MIYGMWASATGIMTESYRQDVIANNLANNLTVGFKRDLINTQERRMAAQELPGLASSGHSAFYDKLGGGTFVRPTMIDQTNGHAEPGNALDAAITGEGFFAVETPKGRFLTRDGEFTVGSDGILRLDNSTHAAVLDRSLRPIPIDPASVRDDGSTQISNRGEIMQNGTAVATLAIKRAGDTMEKEGASLFAAGDIEQLTDMPNPELRGGYTEGSNVDETTEMAAMLKSQRLMEANANMLRYQDQSLARLVSEVGKI